MSDIYQKIKEAEDIAAISFEMADAVKIEITLLTRQLDAYRDRENMRIIREIGLNEQIAGMRDALKHYRELLTYFAGIDNICEVGRVICAQRTDSVTGEHFYVPLAMVLQKCKDAARTIEGENV